VNNLLLVGSIVGVFGVQGQLKLKSITNDPDHLEKQVRTVYLLPQKKPRSHSPEPRAYQILKAFQHKPGLIVLSLKDIITRSAAEELRHAEVYIHEKDARPLDEGEYYLHELYNLHVETVDGMNVGHVCDVLETGANDVLVVARADKSEVLIPLIHDVVETMDIKGGKVVIRPMEGLLEP